jgi:hypothetical protein
MTPASEIPISPARTQGARPFGRAQVHGGRWERVLAVLGVCLPVPLLALTGLSIPLPAGVERLGAALVSWADASVDGADPLGLGDRGSIVLASGERVLVQAPSGPEPDTARRVLSSLPLAGTHAGGAEDRGTPPKDEGGSGGGGSGGGNGGNGGNGGGSTPPDPGGGDPGDEPGLVEGTVKKVTEEPLVEEVDETLDELLPTGNDESSGSILDDALSGLGL